MAYHGLLLVAYRDLSVPPVPSALSDTLDPKVRLVHRDYLPSE
jgi:hypothetical protein